jgi:hypothetical protein
MYLLLMRPDILRPANISRYLHSLLTQAVSGSRAM